MTSDNLIISSEGFPSIERLKTATAQAEVLLYNVDLVHLDESRNELAHFFRNQRIDSYADLTKHFLDS